VGGYFIATRLTFARLCRISTTICTSTPRSTAAASAGSIRSLKSVGDRADRGVGLTHGLQYQPAATLSRVCL
jgi:hypothetical protein